MSAGEEAANARAGAAGPTRDAVPHWLDFGLLRGAFLYSKGA